VTRPVGPLSRVGVASTLTTGLIHRRQMRRPAGARDVDQQAVIDGTRRWVSSLVIGLNLCPFARRVFQAEKISYAVTEARDERALVEGLAGELRWLASCPASVFETTLLIHPGVLQDFLDYNDFLSVAERLVRELGLRGIIQIASFHPEYQFAGTDAGAVENYTNRSPYPMLHLLREASIAAVASDPAELLAIPHRNAETLRRLGREKILETLRRIKRGT